MKIFSGITLCLLLCSCSKSEIKWNACRDSGGIYEHGGVLVYFRTLFTPNGDGYNDVFPDVCLVEETNQFSIDIWDRDKLIFESDDPLNSQWDGTYKGKDVKEGVYDYTIYFVVGGSPTQFDSKITLIRDVEKTYKMNLSEGCFYDELDPVKIEE